MVTKKVKSPTKPKKEKAEMGRPTVMTPEVLQKLKDAFMIGASDREACYAAGINKDTLYNYQKTHPEYVDQKEIWKENPVLIARQSVVNQIKAGDGELGLKYLERKKKDEFSTKSEVGLGVSQELTEALERIATIFPD